MLALLKLLTGKKKSSSKKEMVRLILGKITADSKSPSQKHSNLRPLSKAVTSLRVINNF